LDEVLARLSEWLTKTLQTILGVQVDGMIRDSSVLEKLAAFQYLNALMRENVDVRVDNPKPSSQSALDLLILDQTIFTNIGSGGLQMQRENPFQVKHL
jgi:hypothetical protein